MRPKPSAMMPILFNACCALRKNQHIVEIAAMTWDETFACIDEGYDHGQKQRKEL